MTEWKSSSVVIRHDVGLHARPSVKLTKLAKSFASAIEIAQASWTSSRSGDPNDVLADLIGVLAGLAIAPTAWARGLQRMDRWLH